MMGAVRSQSPADLVGQLTRWAADTTWVEWLELAGSLGRGAGDGLSDVDAGVGVTGAGALDGVQDAVAGFAPTAAVLRQRFGADSTHLLTVYRDGRQLSLVVMPAANRKGLPPQAIALVDKAARLATPLPRDAWDAGQQTRREWTFLACIAAADALKHADRGHGWRSLHSLNESRDRYLQLLAARRQVLFPQFGAVSLENAGEPVPAALAGTLVGSTGPTAIATAISVLVGLLEPFVAEHGLDQLVAALQPSLRAAS